MNRTKIEAMLKDLRKHFGKSDGGGSNYFIDEYVLDELSEWITVKLTSLLAEDEGEVKELPEDVKTFIRIATLEIQSHRSKSDEQMDALFQKAYQLYSKYNVEASQPQKGEGV